MTNLLVVLIGTVAVFSTDPYVCFMCDNEAASGPCDEKRMKKATDNTAMTCKGEACSVTSYVRYSAKGCQSS